MSVDVETGGFNTRTSALLSIGLVELTDAFEPTGRSLVVLFLPDPGMNVTFEAAVTNGYTPEKWTANGAVPLKDGLTKVATWINGQPKFAVAHNAKFDFGFVTAAEDKHAIRTGLPYKSADWLCSLNAFRRLNKDLNLGHEKHSLAVLGTACGHWKADRPDLHDALGDAAACAAGYKWLTGIAKTAGVTL
jgi:DNA polymerase III epsilon subunit-like protein